MNPTRPSGQRPASESLREYGRGLAGGLLFSLPLLYTMEVWWSGFLVHSWTLIAYLVTTFLLLLGYNRYAGMHPDATFGQVVMDSVEEMGIGLIVAAVVLYLLGQVTGEMTLSEILGKVVVEAMTVAVGVSVGTAQLGGQSKEEESDGEGSEGDRAGREESSGNQGGQDRDLKAERRELRADLVLGFCGAVLFASNVAPTEEVLMIAAEASAWKLLGLAGLSIAMAALILFHIEFIKSDPPTANGRTWTMVRQLAATYAMALAASALMLWFFQRFEGTSPGVAVAQTVVLAFPGVLGATAGRLLIR